MALLQLQPALRSSLQRVCASVLHASQKEGGQFEAGLLQMGLCLKAASTLSLPQVGPFQPPMVPGRGVGDHETSQTSPYAVKQQLSQH